MYPLVQRVCLFIGYQTWFEACGDAARLLSCTAQYPSIDSFLQWLKGGLLRNRMLVKLSHLWLRLHQNLEDRDIYPETREGHRRRPATGLLNGEHRSHLHTYFHSRMLHGKHPDTWINTHIPAKCSTPLHGLGKNLFRHHFWWEVPTRMFYHKNTGKNLYTNQILCNVTLNIYVWPPIYIHAFAFTVAPTT